MLLYHFLTEWPAALDQVLLSCVMMQVLQRQPQHVSTALLCQMTMQGAMNSLYYTRRMLVHCAGQIPGLEQYMDF